MPVLAEMDLALRFFLFVMGLFRRGPQCLPHAHQDPGKQFQEHPDEQEPDLPLMKWNPVGEILKRSGLGK